MADMQVLAFQAPDFSNYPVAAAAGLVFTATQAAPAADEQHLISEITFALTTAPAAGVLVSLVSGALTLFQVTIQVAGVFNIQFKNPKKGSVGASAVLTVAAPGGTVVASGGLSGFTRKSW